MGDEEHGAFSTNPSDASPSGSGWVTTKQAAKVLGVSRRSVQGYVRRGLLKARTEGEGVGKTFYVSIDSLDALRNRRSGEALAPGRFAHASPQSAETTNLTESPSESLRHVIDRLEARTVEATELRVRLELTEQAQSTLEEQLTEERRRREEAERERDELRRRLEAAPEPLHAPESAPEASKGKETPTGTAGTQEGAQEPEPVRRPWWIRIFGG
ncbi:MAG: helix-turn-helix domain-containing protein [Actinomycetota bacterium]|nr:helix-turn-helix domain-containing protein [Actinomycetota bacterium]PLS85973.1 MAG: hypothetical protein CYG60_09695 [Actinomycetota bacterium]